MTTQDAISEASMRFVLGAVLLTALAWHAIDVLAAVIVR